MKTLQCGNIILNNENTKICVPITGRTEQEILEQAYKVADMSPDIIEWRADYMETVNYTDVLVKLHEVTGNIPLIYTFRTKDEGGERQIDFETYKEYCIAIAGAAKQNNVAFIDVEACKDNDNIEGLIHKIHERDVKVIGSNHHFFDTPDKEDIVKTLQKMESLGADVCKMAVMPSEKEDVDCLIEASYEADKQLKAPIVTMAMGELGEITRICTQLTGSVITFAAGENSSAPGQLNINKVRELIRVRKGFSIDYNIVLIGFMGTGKTTISRALSRITGLEEVDVDKYIVDKENTSIQEIFKIKGEAYFRDIETQALKEIQKEKGRIISCGGGAVLKDENVQILKDGGVIVLLTATSETVFDRVKDHTTRPVLNDDMSIEHVSRLMQERSARYEKAADIKISVDDNDRVIACYNILKKLEKVR